MGRRYVLASMVLVLAVGVAMPAMGGPNPIGETAASSKKIAKKALKKAKKADRKARKANKKARNAQSAANAAQSTADSAQSTANSAQSSADAAQSTADANAAKLACEGNRTLIAGVCVENAVRGPATTGPNAEVKCNELGGSLPSQETLILYRNTTGADLGDPAEWTSDIGLDTGGLGSYRLIVGDGGTHSYQTDTGANYNYRCVYNAGTPPLP